MSKLLASETENIILRDIFQKIIQTDKELLNSELDFEEEKFYDTTSVIDNNNLFNPYLFSKGLNNSELNSLSIIDRSESNKLIKTIRDVNQTNFDNINVVNDKLDGVFDGNSVNLMGSTSLNSIDNSILYDLDSDEMNFEINELFAATTLSDLKFSNFPNLSNANNNILESLNSNTTKTSLVNSSGNITNDLLFRGIKGNELNDDYISQLLYLDYNINDDLTICQKYKKIKKSHVNRSTNNRKLLRKGNINMNDNLSINRTYITSGRDLYSYVNNNRKTKPFDVASLVMKTNNFELQNLDIDNVCYNNNSSYEDLTASVNHVSIMAARAAQYNKWQLTMRQRPEEFTDNIENVKTLPDDIKNKIHRLNSISTKHETKIDEVLNLGSSDNSKNVFTRPEYLFSNTIGTDVNSNPVVNNISGIQVNTNLTDNFQDILRVFGDETNCLKVPDYSSVSGSYTGSLTSPTGAGVSDAFYVEIVLNNKYRLASLHNTKTNNINNIELAVKNTSTSNYSIIGGSFSFVTNSDITIGGNSSPYSLLIVFPDSKTTHGITYKDSEALYVCGLKLVCDVKNDDATFTTVNFDNQQINDLTAEERVFSMRSNDNVISTRKNLADGIISTFDGNAYNVYEYTNVSGQQKLRIESKNSAFLPNVDFNLKNLEYFGAKEFDLESPSLVGTTIRVFDLQNELVIVRNYADVSTNENKLQIMKILKISTNTAAESIIYNSIQTISNFPYILNTKFVLNNDTIYSIFASGVSDTNFKTFKFNINNQSTVSESKPLNIDVVHDIYYTDNKLYVYYQTGIIEENQATAAAGGTGGGQIVQKNILLYSILNDDENFGNLDNLTTHSPQIFQEVALDSDSSKESMVVDSDYLYFTHKSLLQNKDFYYSITIVDKSNKLIKQSLLITSGQGTIHDSNNELDSKIILKIDEDDNNKKLRINTFTTDGFTDIRQFDLTLNPLTDTFSYSLVYFAQVAYIINSFSDPQNISLLPSYSANSSDHFGIQVDNKIAIVNSTIDQTKTASVFMKSNLQDFTFIGSTNNLLPHTIMSELYEYPGSTLYSDTTGMYPSTGAVSVEFGSFGIEYRTPTVIISFKNGPKKISGLRLDSNIQDLIIGYTSAVVPSTISEYDRTQLNNLGGWSDAIIDSNYTNNSFIDFNTNDDIGTIFIGSRALVANANVNRIDKMVINGLEIFSKDSSTVFDSVGTGPVLNSLNNNNITNDLFYSELVSVDGNSVNGYPVVIELENEQQIGKIKFDFNIPTGGMNGVVDVVTFDDETTLITMGLLSQITNLVSKTTTTPLSLPNSDNLNSYNIMTGSNTIVLNEIINSKIILLVFRNFSSPVSGKVNISNLSFVSSDNNRRINLASVKGSPVSPSTPSETATVAGACATILKAMVKCHDTNNNKIAWPLTPKTPNTTAASLVDSSASNLTIVGEINKLAYNVALSRMFGGVNYRHDCEIGIRLGEKCAIQYLRNKCLEYAESTNIDDNLHKGFTLEKFSGDLIHIDELGITNL